jgi:hypothetical protein
MSEFLEAVAELQGMSAEEKRQHLSPLLRWRICFTLSRSVLL